MIGEQDKVLQRSSQHNLSKSKLNPKPLKYNCLIKMSSLVRAFWILDQAHFTLESLWYTSYVIVQEAGDGPSSIYTSPEIWRFEGQKKFEWMKNLHDVLHDIKWIMFHDISNITLDLSKWGGSNAKLGASWHGSFSIHSKHQLRARNGHRFNLVSHIMWARCKVHFLIIPGGWYQSTRQPC